MNNTIYLFLFLFSSCSQLENTNYSNTKFTPQKLEDEVVNIGKLRNEILYFDSIKINNHLHLVSSIADVYKSFGKPIKIEQMKNSNRRLDFYINNVNNINRYFFKNAIFDGNKDTLILKSLDFDNYDINMVHPQIILSRRTSIQDIYKKFPESTKLRLFNCGNSCYGIIQLSSSKMTIEEQWNLVFLRDTLFNIYYSEPMGELPIGLRTYDN